MVRSHPLEPNPYTGMVKIVSGEVAEDLANYLVCVYEGQSGLGNREHQGWAHLRSSEVKVSSGGMAEDLAHYFG